jgi:uncharacterized OB-fold protein
MARVDPMYARSTLEFPYKHTTGETVGRFLAGLKEQGAIWGRQAAGLGVVVPPYEWVAVADTGTVTAYAVVPEPVPGLHPVDHPFAYVLVRLDGADTALAHVVTERPDDVRVGTRVEAVWKPDGERTGSILDIAGFRLVD